MFGVIMTSLIPSIINNRRYMAQILPIRRKTPYNQSINQLSTGWGDLHTNTDQVQLITHYRLLHMVLCIISIDRVGQGHTRVNIAVIVSDCANFVSKIKVLCSTSFYDAISFIVILYTCSMNKQNMFSCTYIFPDPLMYVFD